MVQEFHVLRCFSCQTFQVQQVKKSKKWTCKMCGEKQSVIKEYGRGSAVCCRQHVQRLNSLRGELLEVDRERLLSQWEQDEEHNKNEDCREDLDQNHESQESAVISRWSKYIDQTSESPKGNEDEEEEEENVYTERDGFRSRGATRKRKKISKLKCDGVSYPLSEDEESLTDSREVNRRPYQPLQHDGELRSSSNKGYFSKYSYFGRSDDTASCINSRSPTASTSSINSAASFSKEQDKCSPKPPTAEVTKHLPLFCNGPSVSASGHKSGESQLDNKDSKWSKFLTIAPTSTQEEVDDFDDHNLSPLLQSGNPVLAESRKASLEIDVDSSKRLRPPCEFHGLGEKNASVLGSQKTFSDICVEESSSNHTNSYSYNSQPASFNKPTCHQPPPMKKPCPSLYLNSLFFTDEDFDDTF